MRGRKSLEPATGVAVEQVQFSTRYERQLGAVVRNRGFARIGRIDRDDRIAVIAPAEEGDPRSPAGG